ncbi:MAG TPA: PhzF family phenazine biosynthesis protein [Candidatus Eremiobacteraceae bacterium]|nr:PhzF family phenazine biosynthesis protein [Candidatus Eremiobacteraceae bacterium]
MRIPIYQVDAFATRRFAGNPAAVMPLERFLDDATLQAVAAENNLAETAYLVRKGDDWDLRWFTPAVEVPLCGHATLASAWAVGERIEPGRQSMVFHSKSGPLTVRKHGSRVVMDFPKRTCTPVEPVPALERALRAKPKELYFDSVNYVAVLDSAETVRTLSPGIMEIAGLDRAGGVVVTAAGDQGYDCVSRYFAPAKGVEEDPVTGSAHCALAPFWSARLKKPEIRAYQASARGGEIICRPKGDRVELEGECVFYMEGTVEI